MQKKLVLLLVSVFFTPNFAAEKIATLTPQEIEHLLKTKQFILSCNTHEFKQTIPQGEKADTTYYANKLHSDSKTAMGKKYNAPVVTPKKKIVVLQTFTLQTVNTVYASSKNADVTEGLKPLFNELYKIAKAITLKSTTESLKKFARKTNSEDLFKKDKAKKNDTQKKIDDYFSKVKTNNTLQRQLFADSSDNLVPEEELYPHQNYNAVSHYGDANPAQQLNDDDNSVNFFYQQFPGSVTPQDRPMSPSPESVHLTHFINNNNERIDENSLDLHYSYNQDTNDFIEEIEKKIEKKGFNDSDEEITEEKVSKGENFLIPQSTPVKFALNNKKREREVLFGQEIKKTPRHQKKKKK